MIGRIKYFIKTLPLARWLVTSAGFVINGERVVGMNYKGGPPESIDKSQPLQNLFWNNEGLYIHKWIHYIEIYQKHFAHLIGTDANILEIGVENGGSMGMWRQYFGEHATLVGIDIDPGCAEHDGVNGHIRIGSQADPKFLQSIVDEFGPFDLVLDDGSHEMAHIRTSFEFLMPHVKDGGIYMVEDLMNAYWLSKGGGYRIRKNFWEEVKNIIDDIHQPYHDRPIRSSSSKYVKNFTVHDSIVVFEKGSRSTPKQAATGSHGHVNPDNQWKKVKRDAFS